MDPDYIIEAVRDNSNNVFCAFMGKYYQGPGQTIPGSAGYGGSLYAYHSPAPCGAKCWDYVEDREVVNSKNTKINMAYGGTTCSRVDGVINSVGRFFGAKTILQGEGSGGSQGGTGTFDTGVPHFWNYGLKLGDFFKNLIPDLNIEKARNIILLIVLMIVLALFYTKFN